MKRSIKRCCPKLKDERKNVLQATLFSFVRAICSDNSSVCVLKAKK